MYVRKQGNPRHQEMRALAERVAERGTVVSNTLQLFFTSSLDAEKIRDHALRMMAAECCEFLQHSEEGEGERWEPYQRWAKAFTVDAAKDDTVITFNYDRVPDVLSGKTERLWIPSPVDADGRPPSLRRRVTVLKLHGSVDWVRKGNLTHDRARGIGWGRREDKRPIGRADGSSVGADQIHCAAVHCASHDLAIATPGPTKARMTGDGGPLKAIWNMAEASLLNADAIVFIGYRIPPTDAGTRAWLADAITSGKMDQRRQRLDEMTKAGDRADTGIPPLLVHTVLGPDVNHVDSRRLTGILEALDAGDCMQVKNWPMGAEDFLGIVGRRQLLTPMSGTRL